MFFRKKIFVTKLINKYFSKSLNTSSKKIIKNNEPKLILGIETSCDDTCASVVDTSGKIYSNEKNSQIIDVVECGGILTVNSIRLHSNSIKDVITKALKNAGVNNFNQLSSIAVTTEPGQFVSLNVGLKYAQKLALTHNLPLIPIHHMEAHALTSMICYPNLKFPFLALLISGGHSQIVLVKNLNLFFLLGNSNDSGPGEVLDKVARNFKIKNLGKPFSDISCGQSIEMLSKLSKNSFLNKKKYQLKKNHSCDFDYNGLKTFYTNLVKKFREENLNYEFGTVKPNGFKSVDIDAPLDETCILCENIQFKLVNYFLDKLEIAFKFIQTTNILDENVKSQNEIKLKEIDYSEEKNVKLDLVVSGGVACNDVMMNMLKNQINEIKGFYEESYLNLLVPRPNYLCTDNGIMIAWNGALKFIDKSHNFLVKDETEILKLIAKPISPLGIDISNFLSKLKL